MKRVLLVLSAVLSFSVGCASAAEEDEWTQPVHVPETAGAEVESVDDDDASVDDAERDEERHSLVGVRTGGGDVDRGQGGGGTGGGTLMLGRIAAADIPPPTPEERAATEARRQNAQARAQARRAAAEAEYQARCASVVITPGLPPAPPQAPSTPGLDGLRPTYEASLAAPLTRPRDNSMAGASEWAQTVFAQWVQLYSARLRTLDQAVAATPESDRQHALVWLAHAYGTFVERFQSAPIADEIERDPELRAMYIEAFVAQTAPLLERAVQPTDAVTLPGAWAQWKAEMQAWLAQEACALH